MPRTSNIKFFKLIDVNSGYEKEYKKIAGDERHYLFASSLSNLSSIESIAMAAITQCPVDEPSTTTYSFRVLTNERKCK